MVTKHGASYGLSRFDPVRDHSAGATLAVARGETIMSNDHAVMISGEANVERARWLAVRSALKLETRGLKRSHSPSARVLANQITGQNHRSAVKAYGALNAFIVAELGADFDRPLGGRP
jgi:hypothetical protein